MPVPLDKGAANGEKVADAAGAAANFTVALAEGAEAEFDDGAGLGIGVTPGEVKLAENAPIPK